ncbi:amidase [Pseudonocardia benzenivorans]|uniref:Amidase n=2 Tax=Pseudonocardia TaxID=1847 RepID=F4D0J4_PSEUX|nr:amidase [Pseudonocardia dioxanivorans]AEA26790.1 Amidase [Pseudonocardia dioxanivorans CB1190]GJF04828.1 glutamyl-tRNA(Gln) amidotransferase subunit A [Pseudonocardia sp. D17]
MYLSITDAAAALRSGETTSVALTEAGYAVADAHDEALGVYLRRFDETALAAAAKADEELAAGVDKGPLHGIPLGIKDIIATDEGETTAQSLVLDREWGTMGDAPVVARLRAAGAVITGKLTTMEYAIGIPDVEKPFPVPRNPWNTDHYPGGSSSGTGNGVAAGMFLGGLGTDTGGSIRYPATSCGITGLKQTFGRVPKFGCVPLGYSYDHIGPMARTAADCAAMLAVIAGHDARDACSVDRPVDDYVSGLTGSLEGMRIGVDPLLAASELTVPELEEVLAAATAELTAAGATVVPVELPLYKELTTATMVGMAAESYAYHRGDLQSRWADYGSGTRMAVSIGALVSGGDHVQAQRVRRAGQKMVAELFADVDLIVTPTSACGAPEIEKLTFDAIIGALHTPYWNALGNPAMSVPMGYTRDGLPLGLQIVGRPFDEAAVLAAGHAYQLRTDWHTHVPAMVSDLLAA